MNKKMTIEARILRTVAKLDDREVSLKQLKTWTGCKTEKVLRDHMWCMDSRKGIIRHNVKNNKVVAHIVVAPLS